MRIHFISGLPRSGSTLLAALLSQNPGYVASMSSPVAGIYTAMLTGISNKNEFSIFITPEQRERLMSGVFDAYYGPYGNDKTVFDTNRLWCSKMPALATLFPQSRVIACVRNVAWVVDSIERLVRRNVFELSKIFDYEPTGTVYSRGEALTNGDGMVGYAWGALKEAFYGEHSDSLILLQYETLVSRPEETMERLYQLLGESPFQHDFDNVVFEAADEFDARLGTPGLHRVARRVAAASRDPILPPDLYNRYVDESFWLDPSANTRGVTIL
jgi:sulfotransferase